MPDALDIVPASRTRPPLGMRGFAVAAVLLVAAYYGFGRVGLELPVALGVVTPVWAPTGIALFALATWGVRLWPAVTAAALLVNVTAGLELAPACAIAVGNTVEVVAAAVLLRWLGFDSRMDRVRDAIALQAAAFVAPVLSAANGVAVLLVSDHVTAADAPSRLLLWYLGDATGNLLVAPLLFVLLATGHAALRQGARHLLELGALVALVLVASAYAFHDGDWHQPYLLFPLFVWACVRHRQLGAVVSTFLAAAVAVVWTVRGATPPVAGFDVSQTAELLQAVIGMVAVTLQLLAATLAERAEAVRRYADAYARERAANERLTELDVLKDDLLAAVSHELRTPLTTIVAGATTLRELGDQLDPDTRGGIETYLLQQAKRLDRMLSNLLDLERLRRGLLDADREEVQLRQLVEDAVAECVVGERDVRFDLDDVVVRLDAGKVERIVENLVMNAVRHAPRSTTLWVAARVEEGGVVISVDDDGDGVPDGDKTSIFEPFVRGTSDVAQHAPGTGIGLSLVAQFARAHGGRAWVEDRVGGGASFRVHLAMPEPGSDGGSVRPAAEQL